MNKCIINMAKKISVFILTLLLTNTINFAQENLEFTYKIGGAIQAWGSFGQINNSDTNSMGWGLRRVRLKANSTLGDKIKGIIQIELTSLKLLDASIEYNINRMFTIRSGRFVGAGVRSAGLTSIADIDITERPLTTQQWGISTIGSDFRDYGVDIAGNFGDLKATVTFHNGDGSKNILNRMSGAGLKNGSLAISGMLGLRPAAINGLEAGLYYGMGNKEINDYKSYNGYLYYEPGPFRVKTEVIGWTNTTADKDLDQFGYYIFGGYKIIDCIEALIRYENYDPNKDLNENEQSLITVGAAYSVFPTKWTAGKITAAYIINSESGVKVDNNVFQLVMQLIF